jgi:6-phosphofructokinase 2
MLTLGEKGALMVTGDGTLRAPGIKVKLDSAVGAGDSFVAALVYRLANGSNLEDAFAYGVAAGTAALLTPGTQLALKPDIDDLLGRVTVEHLPPAG